MLEKLLVIDDNKTITKVVSAIATRAGYQPVVVHSLAELISLLIQQTDFTYACVDYKLEDAPNGEAVDLVVQHKIPAFVLTGFLDEKTRQHILTKKVIDYIPKETIQTFDYISRLLNRLRENKQIKILVVDDAKSSRSFVKSLLKRHNFIIIEAEHGQHALELLANSEHSDVKLVITDNEMPVMDGIKLTSEIRAKFDNEALAIIGISASEQTDLAARFLKNGANDFLLKPFGYEEFYTRIFRNLEYIENVARTRHAANHDFLTDLYNRRHFFELVPQLMDAAAKKQQTCCVALLDLDKFKAINDCYGHDIGDQVLQEMAYRLNSHFPEDNLVVARFGGEEFCIFFANTSRDEATGRLEFFRHHLEVFNFELTQLSLNVTTSIGISQLQADGLDAAISRADQALYQAKQNGRNQVSEL